METVTIKDVQKNARDWYEITLDGDDRVLATKDSKLAEVATASIGGAVEVAVNTRTSGKFTNHYLAEIGGVKEERAKFASVPRKPTIASSGGQRSPETQERIARQWAYGRAIELLMASEQTVEFPPGKITQDAIKQVADWLLEATK